MRVCVCVCVCVRVCVRGAHRCGEVRGVHAAREHDDEELGRRHRERKGHACGLV